MTRIATRVAIVLAVLLAGPLWAEEVVPGESVLGFAVVLGERRVEGRFEEWTAEIDVEAGVLVVEVATGSATTGDALIDAVMLGGGWLDVRAHPRAVFRSDTLAEGGDGRTASGVLSIAGADLPVDVAIRAAAPRRYEARATIDRHAVGIGPDGPPVGPAVEVRAMVVLTP